MKYCIDCIHKKTDQRNCAHPKANDAKDDVYGLSIKLCSVMRSRSDLCGENAKWFEPRLPDPGSGWRYLSVGETVRYGDQIWVIIGQEWSPLSCVGHKVTTETIRRSVTPEPGEGWRLLQLGDVTKDGDEFWCYAQNKWDKSVNIGKTVEHFPYECVYRRRTLPDVGEGWRQLKKGETVEHGDEFWSDIKRKWDDNVTEGAPLGVMNNFTYRRRIGPRLAKCQLGHESRLNTSGGQNWVACVDMCWSGPAFHDQQKAIEAWNCLMEKVKK